MKKIPMISIKLHLRCLKNQILKWEIFQGMLEAAGVPQKEVTFISGVYDVRI